MVLQKKKLKKVIALELKIAIAILALVLILKDVLKPYFRSPVMDYVATHIDFLKTIILFTFLFCSIILILIVWLLEWGDRQQRAAVTKFVSRLVCENYYGNYRKTNVYKAIKTALSKFSRTDQQEEAIQTDDPNSAPTRYVNPSAFVIRSFDKEHTAVPTDEDTSDGIRTAYFANGKVEKEVTYKNNKLEGVYRTFYEDGTLHQERYYKDGKLDGLFKAYDEFGVPYFEITYRDGKQEGITNIYFKNGSLQYRDTFKDGVRVHRDTYSETGELKFSQNEYND